MNILNRLTLIGADRNILMAAFREEDAAAGKDVSASVRLRIVISAGLE